MDRHPAPWVQLLAKWAAVPLALGGVTLVSRAAGANEITAGFLLLVAVLGLATWAGWAVGAVASVAATLCLNYFFLPPTGTPLRRSPLELGGAGLLPGRFRPWSAGWWPAPGRRRRRPWRGSGSWKCCTTSPSAFSPLTLSPPIGALWAKPRPGRCAPSERIAGALPSPKASRSLLGGSLEVDGTLLDATSRVPGAAPGAWRTAGTSYIPLHIGGQSAASCWPQSPPPRRRFWTRPCACWPSPSSASGCSARRPTWKPCARATP